MFDTKYIILICVACCVLSFVLGRTRKRYKDDENLTQYRRRFGFFPQYEKKQLLSKAEYYFWRRLKAKCDEKDIIVCPKVRIEDFAFAKSRDYKTRQKYRGYIKSRHVDFLLCDRDLNILAGVELDDGSHNQANAKKVDMLKDDVFTSIDIPLFRISASRNKYDKELDTIFQELFDKDETKNKGIII